MPTINYVTRIEFEEGAIERLPTLLAELGGKRPLIATDRGLVATGLVARVLALFPEPPVVFDGTPPNPTEDAVSAAYAMYRDADCDSVIGLGGGSSIDLAKAVRLLSGATLSVGQGERLALCIVEMALQHRRVGELEIVPRIIPLGAQEHVAIGQAAPVIIEVIDPLDALHIHGQPLQPVGELGGGQHGGDAADLLEIGELRDLHAVAPDFPA